MSVRTLVGMGYSAGDRTNPYRVIQIKIDEAVVGVIRYSDLEYENNTSESFAELLGQRIANALMGDGK